MVSVNPFRLLVKAAALFILANLLFAGFQPPVGTLSIFNHIIPGRVRFAAETHLENLPASGVLLFEDMDAMFASHVISKGPKPADEYRVILLGDSSVWGFEIPPQDTLSEQIDRLNLWTVDGKRVRAYNLSYPLPSNARDLITLQKAMDYQPDLVLWLVTLKTFESRTAEKDFLIPQSDRVLALIHRYHIKVDAEKFLRPGSFSDRTIVGSSVRLKKIAFEQLYGLLLTATSLDADLPDLNAVRPLSQDVSSASDYGDFTLATQSAFAAWLDFTPISAAQDIAGRVPVLVVNEPMFRAVGQNSNVRYNDYYPRWAYDYYRSSLANWMQGHSGYYIDLWAVMPNDQFVRTPLHLEPAGEEMLAHDLAPGIARLSSAGR